MTYISLVSRNFHIYIYIYIYGVFVHAVNMLYDYVLV